MEGVESLSSVATSEESRVHVRRISEEMQKDEDLMMALRRVVALPDKTVVVVATDDGILIGSGGESARSEERRVGQAGVSTSSYRWSSSPLMKKTERTEKK